MIESDGRPGEAVRRKWLRLGLAVAFLHTVFLLVVLSLLEFDPVVAVVVAAVVGVVGGLALTALIRYRY